MAEFTAGWQGDASGEAACLLRYCLPPGETHGNGASRKIPDPEGVERSPSETERRRIREECI